MNQAVANHLVLALEALTALAAGAAADGAVVRPDGGVDVRVRVQEVLRLEGQGGAAHDLADEAHWGPIEHHGVWQGHGRCRCGCRVF